MKTLIKIITIIGFAMVFSNLPAQQAIVSFEYDDAGNRTHRSISTIKATETEIENLTDFIVPTPADNDNADELNATVYPNPTYGIINIEVDENESETVAYKLYDQNGKWIDLGNSFDPYFPTKTKTDIHYQYVHLPLSIKYYFSDNALKFYALLGLSYQYTLSLEQVVSLEYENGNIETNETDFLEVMDEDDKLLPHNFGLRIGFGISYNISDNISVFTEPIFHYSVLSEFRQKEIERDFETNLYSIGLQTGIAWHF